MNMAEERNEASTPSPTAGKQSWEAPRVTATAIKDETAADDIYTTGPS
jgi:hypothetical protein